MAGVRDEANFKYRARNSSGELIGGVIKAKNPQDAVNRITGRGLQPVDVRPMRGMSLFDIGRGRRAEHLAALAPYPERPAPRRRGWVLLLLAILALGIGALLAATDVLDRIGAWW